MTGDWLTFTTPACDYCGRKPNRRQGEKGQTGMRQHVTRIRAGWAAFHAPHHAPATVDDVERVMAADMVVYAYEDRDPAGFAEAVRFRRSLTPPPVDEAGDGWGRTLAWFAFLIIATAAVVAAPVKAGVVLAAGAVVFVGVLWLKGRPAPGSVVNVSKED